MEDLLLKLLTGAGPAGIVVVAIYLLTKYNDFNHVEARQRETIELLKDQRETLQEMKIGLVKIEQILSDRLPRYGNGGPKQ